MEKIIRKKSATRVTDFLGFIEAGVISGTSIGYAFGGARGAKIGGVIGAILLGIIGGIIEFTE